MMRRTTSIALFFLACTPSTDGDEPSSGGTGSTSGTDSTDGSTSDSAGESSGPTTTGDPSGDSTGDDAGMFEEPYGPGARLQPYVLDGGDGAIVFDGWYDTELELDCTLQETSRDGWRCLPGRYNSAPVYSDAECTQRVYLPDSCSELPEYVFASETLSFDCNAEADPKLLYSVGEPLAESATIYSNDGLGGPCAKSPPLEGPRYALEPVTDTSSFVAFEPQVVELTPQIAQRVYVGEDDSYQWTNTIDVDRDARCVGWGQRPLQMCAPTNTGNLQTNLHGDETCSDEGIVLGGNPLDEDCVVEIALHEGAVHELGESVPPEDIHRSVDIACTPVEDTYPNAWTLGPPVAAGTYPAMELKPVGTGRLTAQRLATPDGTEVGEDWAFGWNDAEYGECYIRQATDGLRCAPSATSADLIHWADPGCSDEPLQHVPEDSELDEGSTRRLFEEPCRVFAGLVVLGPVHEGAVYTMDSTDTCVEQRGATEGWRYHTIAERLEADEFVAVQRRLD